MVVPAIDATSPRSTVTRRMSGMVRRDNGRPSVRGASQAIRFTSTTTVGGKAGWAPASRLRLETAEALTIEALPPLRHDLSRPFDARGDPWVSASHGSFGRLYHLDRGGMVREEYEMVPGLEDIEFDAAGRLWSLSESGSRKYFEVWATRFPFVFEIGVSKLR